MGRIFRARVTGGMLEPLDGAELQEGAEVVLAVIGSPGPSSEAAFQRSAGSWNGLVDAEALIDAIYADRTVAMRDAPEF